MVQVINSIFAHLHPPYPYQWLVFNCSPIWGYGENSDLAIFSGLVLTFLRLGGELELWNLEATPDNGQTGSLRIMTNSQVESVHVRQGRFLHW